ncbi:hypothetical protein PHLGIDRAFT_18778 [Phlebiopsis gigantea 11061_1 CR5-6]|uniref:Uncharacterized protein n=1 Tax=Phlebiopsis gigantea (strain 11061_1 CR5-6) TaxID=745531 RepID=A0A0C3PPM9_PHLG1|nr:hypothetical protein PHLGIDRAFT_18778 [Phlebiopsis gigantea 11061_1 CR5-6]
MATPFLCNQVAERWQHSFSRLNRDKEGISGLLEFSQAWLMAKDWLRPRGKSELAQKAAFETRYAPP